MIKIINGPIIYVARNVNLTLLLQKEQEYSEKQSALVNKAYRTLQKPLSRGLYMVSQRNLIVYFYTLCHHLLENLTSPYFHLSKYIWTQNIWSVRFVSTIK